MNTPIDDQTSGKLDNVFTDAELNKFLNYFNALKEKYHTDRGQTYSCIDERHILYSWFCDNVFKKIQAHVAAPIKFFYAGLMDSQNPLNVHSDYYYKTEGREPFMAFLIPLKVNDGNEGLERASTVIFNEIDTYVDHDHNEDRKYRNSQQLLERPLLTNNCLHLGGSLLSHVNPEVLRRISLQKILEWNRGSVIFWNEKHLHCSNNYAENGVTHKQAIVMHTYMEYKA